MLFIIAPCILSTPLHRGHATLPAYTQQIFIRRGFRPHQQTVCSLIIIHAQTSGSRAGAIVCCVGDKFSLLPITLNNYLGREFLTVAQEQPLS